MRFLARPMVILALVLLTTGSGGAAEPTPAPACKYPVELLWHRDGEAGTHKMGVSVRNANGQQVPGLGVEAFDVVHLGAAVGKADGFTVQQSKNAISQAPSLAEGQPPPAAADPIQYDVYFAVDLSQSMGGNLVGPQGKEATRLTWIARVIDVLVRPNKQGTFALFDQADRVYIAGFTNRVETAFMNGVTANRESITKGLQSLNEFTPASGPAAVYSALLHNLSKIQENSAEYSNPQQKREAVLILLTDSWNGIDPDRGRPIKGCGENDPFTDKVREQILKARDATAGNMKLYLLGLGKVGAAKDYSLDGPAGKKCRIAEAEAQVLDGRSFRAIADPRLATGGFYASEDPVDLAKWITAQFEALKSAYEVTYKVPAEAPAPGTWKVTVKVGEQSCSDAVEVRSSFVQHAAKREETSPTEMALFVASTLLGLLFLPRSLGNLGTLGGSSEPKAEPNAKKRKKKG
jgi:hypothetical protein